MPLNPDLYGSNVRSSYLACPSRDPEFGCIQPIVGNVFPHLCTSCSTVVFRTTHWETTLLLHLLSLITKTRPKSKLVLQSTLILWLILSQLANTTGFSAQLQQCSRNTNIIDSDSLPPRGHALAKGTRGGQRRGRPRAGDGRARWCPRRRRQRRRPRANNGLEAGVAAGG